MKPTAKPPAAVDAQQPFAGCCGSSSHQSLHTSLRPAQGPSSSASEAAILLRTRTPQAQLHSGRPGWLPQLLHAAAYSGYLQPGQRAVHYHAGWPASIVVYSLQIAYRKMNIEDHSTAILSHHIVSCNAEPHRICLLRHMLLSVVREVWPALH